MPAGYTATSSTDLLRLDLMDVGPLGLRPAPLAHVVIGQATADMAHAQPAAATATADYLNAQPAGITVPASLLETHAEQTAPPAHPTPDAHSLVTLNSPLLRLGVGNISASAGQAGPLSCARAHGSASIADASVLSGTQDRSLLSLPTQLNGSADVALDSHASRAVADTGLARFDLFNGTRDAMGIQVLTEPKLTGIAGGTAESSSVSYQAPVLDVALPDGTHTTIDSAHADLSVAISAGAVTSLLGSLSLPALPISARLEARLSLGGLTRSVAATSVSGSATTLRLQILASTSTATGLLTHVSAGATSVLDLSIGALAVTATAPAAPVITPPIHCDGYGTGCPPKIPCPQALTYPSPSCTVPVPVPSSSLPPVASQAPNAPVSSAPGVPTSSPGSSAPIASPSTGASAPGSPSPSSTVLATTSGNLPLTGSDTAYVLGGGMILLIAGSFVVIATRRRRWDGEA